MLIPAVPLYRSGYQPEVYVMCKHSRRCNCGALGFLATLVLFVLALVGLAELSEK